MGYAPIGNFTIPLSFPCSSWLAIPDTALVLFFACGACDAVGGRKLENEILSTSAGRLDVLVTFLEEILESEWERGKGGRFFRTETGLAASNFLAGLEGAVLLMLYLLYIRPRPDHRESKWGGVPAFLPQTLTPTNSCSPNYYHLPTLTDTIPTIPWLNLKVHYLPNWYVRLLTNNAPLLPFIYYLSTKFAMTLSALTFYTVDLFWLRSQKNA